MIVTKLMWGIRQIRSRIPFWIFVKTEPFDSIFKPVSSFLNGQNFFDLPFVFSVDFNCWGWIIVLSWKRVVCSLSKAVR